MIVRLKGDLVPRQYIELPEFQFYDSPIKRKQIRDAEGRIVVSILW